MAPGRAAAALDPLESLYDATRGDSLPLPPDLAALYGPLRFPARPGTAHVVGNFVTSLDGVAALNAPGQMGGGAISGHDRHDRAVMGLLRAAADAVIVGAGTLRASPGHLWTPGYIYPPLAAPYAALRESLGKSGPPLNVLVSASGAIDLDLPVIRSGAVPALIVTTSGGAARIGERGIPRGVEVAAIADAGPVGARAILSAVGRTGRGGVILVEGGPRLMADFLAEGALDELFLTLAPQVAGRDASAERPGFVAGRRFAPEHPLWGALVGVKRGGSHLFLRYSFDSRPAGEEGPRGAARIDGGRRVT